MTQTWKHDPQFKLEISGETFINDEALSIQLTRPENNISFLVLTVNDYKSKNYVDVFDAFDAIVLSLRYGSDTWTKVFSGVVTSAMPRLSMQGEVLDVAAWGEGNALVKTHCDESYGVESINNSAVDTPKEIVEDIIDEHVNKIFGAAAASNYALTKTEIENVHAGLSVTFLNSQYLNNFVNINRVCDLANAYAQGLEPAQVSVHWHIDPDKNFYLKKIDANHTAVGGTAYDWDRYWGGTSGTSPGTQASSTITVKEDMILYDFRKNVEEYANHIVLSSKFRMPGEDYWTEDNGGAALWDSNDVSVTNSATAIVGSHSILLQPTSGVAAGEAWYPSAKNASWDLTKCGSKNTIPVMGFFARKNEDIGAATHFRIYSSAGNYVESWVGLNTLITENDKWVYLEFPVGPYFDLMSTERVQMVETGTIDWTDIDWIEFVMVADTNDDLYIDDLHFSGVIVREAKDTSEITANKTYQKIIRNDTAVNDTLIASDDSGTAAMLAYAELLRRSQTPIVGMIQIPMAVDILPGQTVYIQACQKSDNSYRIEQDFRIKEIKHIIGRQARFGGFETQLNLTSDVTNTHAFGVPTRYSLLMEYAGALGHSEARNLKGGDLDNLIPRLTKAY